MWPLSSRGGGQGLSGRAAKITFFCGFPYIHDIEKKGAKLIRTKYIYFAFLYHEESLLNVTLDYICKNRKRPRVIISD